MEEDLAAGLVPAGVLLNLGTTNTCGYDPVYEYKELVEEFRLWLHIDAAYAGPALLLQGQETAILGTETETRSPAVAMARYTESLRDFVTSFNFNGSKWFLCGFDLFNISCGPAAFSRVVKIIQICPLYHVF